MDGIVLCIHQFPLSLCNLNNNTTGSFMVMLTGAGADERTAAKIVGVLFLAAAVGCSNRFLELPLGVCGDLTLGQGVLIGAVGDVADIIGVCNGAGGQHADVEETGHHDQTHHNCEESSSKNLFCHYFVLLSNWGSEISAAAPA